MSVSRTSIRQYIVVAISATLAISCGGGQKTALEPSGSAPAAQGTVESARGDNGNTQLKVGVKHLAPPQNIAAGASTYVVWANPVAGNAEPQNLGALAIGDDRTGELRTVTPLHSFELSVTPEASAKVQRPSNEPILRARISPR